MKTRGEHKMYFVPSIVRLGVKSLQCRRNGICEIKILESFEPLLQPLVGKSYAILCLNSEQLLGIYFLVSSMSEDTLKRYFNNNMFTVEEIYRFEVYLSESFRSYLIPAGHYKLIRHFDYGKISLVDKDQGIPVPINQLDFLYPKTGHVTVMTNA